MSIVDRRNVKIVLDRTGPTGVDRRLAEWCGLTRKRWIGWAAVTLLAAGWSWAWLIKAFGDTPEFDEWCEHTGQPRPDMLPDRPAALQAIADWVETQPQRDRRKLWKYFACVSLRSCDWFLDWIGAPFGHPKGHVTRILARMHRLLKSHLPQLAVGH